MLKHSLLPALCSLALLSGSAQAGLLLSNWNIAGDTLTFDITGAIDAGATIGANSEQNLFIGVPGLSGWVTAASATSTVTNNGGSGFRAVSNTAAYSPEGTSFAGDIVLMATEDGASWLPGDMVDISAAISGGTLVAANINPANIIISAGRSNGATQLPDPATQVGAVPTPPSLALLAVGLVGLARASRRRRRAEAAHRRRDSVA